MSSQAPQVVIIGGGVCGLVLSLLLAKHQIPSIVCESKPLPDFEKPTETFDTRIFALNLSSIALLELIGAWSLVVRKCHYQQMKVWDKTGRGEISFSAKAHLLESLGAMVEQHALLKALYECAEQSTYITIKHEIEISGIECHEDGVQITADHISPIPADLCIAADGANSFVRNLLQIPIKKWSYGQKAIVATVEVEGLEGHAAYQRFASDGPLAFLPLPKEKWYSIVWTTSESNAERLLSLKPEAFTNELVHQFDGEITKACLHGTAMGFALHAQLAKHFVYKRCALVGDAAHTIHPLAGQGLNLGLQDCEALMLNIVKAIKAKKPIDAYLAHFARERKSESVVMLMVMEGFKRTFGSDNLLLKKCRSIGFNWANKQRALKSKFIEYATGQPITSLKLEK